MAKFAHDCIVKLDQIVERLATTLGEGTDELGLRTGIHSGEVTAGVLRGENGRFQLFGGEWTGQDSDTECLSPFSTCPLILKIRSTPLQEWRLPVLHERFKYRKQLRTL